MFHARLFGETARCRDDHFRPTRESLVSKEKSSSAPWLDGNPQLDRPLFVQFCANRPQDLLEAAQYVAPYCDGVDLNLGCPQGIAKSGHYGAFLQEDWDSIYNMINKLHHELSIPVTAKMRILETREKTLEYAKMILSAGANILTVHGRRREQKGHQTGLADWSMIRFLRDNLPPETVLFANGNILNSEDLEACLAATGADGIMSAEGNLSDPTIFAKPPKEYNPREYWYDPNGRGGYRLDAVFRRYLDIIHRYSLDEEPPQRKPLYIPGDSDDGVHLNGDEQPNDPRKRNNRGKSDPNLKSMQGHLFQLLHPMLSKHTDIRDALAKTRAGDIDGFERVLSMVEAAVRRGLEANATPMANGNHEATATPVPDAEMTPKQRTEAKYKRPWWVCQPHVRPLPEEALKLGSIQLSKKDRAKLDMLEKAKAAKGETVGVGLGAGDDAAINDVAIQRTDTPDAVDREQPEQQQRGVDPSAAAAANELPKPALVCG